VAAELIQFFGGVSILALPGILLAFGLGFGARLLDRLTHGCCLGLALAAYFASAVNRPSIEQHVADIMDGRTAPDSPEMKIVRIDPDGTAKLPVLWRSTGGLTVVQVWPK
jgi:hypothetical protein